MAMQAGVNPLGRVSVDCLCSYASAGHSNINKAAIVMPDGVDSGAEGGHLSIWPVSKRVRCATTQFDGDLVDNPDASEINIPGSPAACDAADEVVHVSLDDGTVLAPPCGAGVGPAGSLALSPREIPARSRKRSRTGRRLELRLAVQPTQSLFSWVFPPSMAHYKTDGQK
jgi:hypothetical protein